MSFAGVIALIYSDLVAVPVLNVYLKYYGWRVMLYVFAVFFGTMAFSGFPMEQLFAALDIVPEVVEGESATAKSYFQLDYTFWFNLVALGLSAFLYGVYRMGIGAPGEERDAVCGIKTEEGAPTATHGGCTYRFCSEGCRRRFERDPGRYVEGSSA